MLENINVDVNNLDVEVIFDIENYQIEPSLSGCCCCCTSCCCSASCAIDCEEQ